MNKEIIPIVSKHSTVAGGSSCARIIQCPGSVALSAKMPPKPANSYMSEGTLLHNVIAEHLDKEIPLEDFIGTKFESAVLTQELIDNKLIPILDFLNEVDPHNEMSFAIEAEVSFGDAIPGAFGSVDLIGRLGDTAVIWDHKFGSGEPVAVENNSQLLFYTAAAMHTPGLEWVFDGAKELLCVIAQPPYLKQWRTTLDRPKSFEKELLLAVKASQKTDAALATGKGCRFCNAKPICPLMTGEVDRSLKLQIKSLDAASIGKYLTMADTLEDWIRDLRALASQLLENGQPVPGYKLVAKRAIRQWANDHEAAIALSSLGISPHKELEVISPAQAEKLLKKEKKELPSDLVVAVSSGSTLANEDDPRPALLQIGRQLIDALNKLN